MTARITVIIPTIGRASLGAAVRSCSGADEVIVAWDCAVSGGSMPLDVAGARVVAAKRGGDHGYGPRTTGMAQATGSHICFLDDDDVYTPDAIRLMREAACDVPVIFRMDHPQHGILWRNQQLEFGNVGTPMFLVPNRPEALGEWAAHAPGLPEPGGDYTFIRGCVERMGGPVWRPEVTAIIRPDRGPSIAIVTPWVDHLELAPDYIAATRVARPTDEVIVVDNGSRPPLCATEPLAGAFTGRRSRWVARSDDNLGFSGGCNRGLEEATADAVLFLNNDIAPVDGRWLEAIRDALEPGVLVGAEIRTSAHGNVDGVALPYLDGWCLAGMTDDFRDLGGWDETYQEPSYFGDNDLSLRARAAGMTLREARVGLIHKRNATAGPASDPAVLAATVANRARFSERARELLEVPA